MSIPERIGKYELLEAIGRGGFATVYRARDPLMRRVVAIKLCAEPDEDLRRRFLREAQIAGSLDHPNIVRGFDCGFDDAGVYLVEEYLDGEDLKQMIQARLPIAHRLRVAILIEVAQAMGYAHSKGVFHRDLKPGNIRVLESGRVKIMDFGVAKTSSASMPLTKAGTLLGTAGYIAPEQVLGQPFDHRVDIFAFGALAYELLTYTRPFTGESVSERLHSVLDTTPELLSKVWRKCPASVERTIHRCLEKDPAVRYQSFAEVLADLERAHGELVRAEEESTATIDLEAAGVPADERPGLEKTIVVAPVVVAPPAAPAKETPPGQPTAAPPPPPPPPTPPPRPPPPAAGASRSTSAPAVAPVLEKPAAPTAAVSQQVASQEQPAATKSRPEKASLPGGKRAWLLASVAAVAAALAVVAILALLGRRGESTEPASVVAPAAVAAPAEPSEAIAAPSGRLVLSASPWGEVVKVIASDGRVVDVPPGAATPLVLPLPPGDYEIHLARPGGGVEPRSCRVTVQDATLAQCRLELGGVTGLDYFKASGWWP